MEQRKPPRVVIVTSSNAEATRLLTGNYDPSPVNDAVHTEPTIVGHVGRAWLCDMPALLRQHGVAPEDDAVVASWVVEAPWAHPVWHSYSLILVHLRPMPDGRPTKVYLPGATHELWLHAMDPDLPRQPIISGEESPIPACLTPKNFAAQLVAQSDAAAADLIRQAAEDIANAAISPDSDFRSAWAARFGDNMVRRV